MSTNELDDLLKDAEKRQRTMERAFLKKKAEKSKEKERKQKEMDMKRKEMEALASKLQQQKASEALLKNSPSSYPSLDSISVLKANLPTRTPWPSSRASKMDQANHLTFDELMQMADQTSPQGSTRMLPNKNDASLFKPVIENEPLNASGFRSIASFKRASYYTPKELADLKSTQLAKSSSLSPAVSNSAHSQLIPNPMAKPVFGASGKTLMIGSKLKSSSPSVPIKNSRARQARNGLARPNPAELITLNQQKRDLRTIEEIQLDLKKKWIEKQTKESLGQSAVTEQPEEESKKNVSITRTVARHVKPPNLDQLDRKAIKSYPLPPKLDDVLSGRQSQRVEMERKKEPGLPSTSYQRPDVDKLDKRKKPSIVKDPAPSDSQKRPSRMTLPTDDDDLPVADVQYYGQNYSKIIRKMFNYDEHRYDGLYDETDDLSDMEVDYNTIRKEENKSARIAIMEDEMERERQKRKVRK